MRKAIPKGADNHWNVQIPLRFSLLPTAAHVHVTRGGKGAVPSHQEQAQPPKAETAMFGNGSGLLIASVFLIRPCYIGPFRAGAK
jgi:hypothetical protein